MYAIYVTILVQLLLVLFSYGYIDDFHKYICERALKVISKINNSEYLKKLKSNSEEFYMFSINILVASTVLAAGSLDSSPVWATGLYIVSLIIYLTSFALKYKQGTETFEKDYLIEFLIATGVGLFFSFIDHFHSWASKKEDFDVWSLLFFFIFVLYYFTIKKHHKTLKIAK